MLSFCGEGGSCLPSAALCYGAVVRLGDFGVVEPVQRHGGCCGSGGLSALSSLVKPSGGAQRVVGAGRLKMRLRARGFVGSASRGMYPGDRVGVVRRGWHGSLVGAVATAGAVCKASTLHAFGAPGTMQSRGAGGGFGDGSAAWCERAGGFPSRHANGTFQRLRECSSALHTPRTLPNTSSFAGGPRVRRLPACAIPPIALIHKLPAL
jgi:hypothetical protein